ncbi:hypothetical protein CTI12_AA614520 [Artemisia annua]|uniref:Uncharacterized protein n=1 Tax=Artemisia annua TaxID=35608 RepID=A0A2U1KDR5_ARTAN|nr:hypothetical protein CTI12_AA614520 [Artemisia annua]
MGQRIRGHIINGILYQYTNESALSYSASPTLLFPHFVVYNIQRAKLLHQIFVATDTAFCVVIKSYKVISGMPECKLGLNDKFMLDAQYRAPKGKPINLEDIRFHRKYEK